MTFPSAAWTPDAPDGGLVESPSALIAAGEQSFDPESLDHFDGAAVCGAVAALVIPPSAAHPGVFQRVHVQCDGDDGHYPGTPHDGHFSWGDSNTLPAEPACDTCADVGVRHDGEPCTCAAGDPFREAIRLRRASVVEDDPGGKAPADQIRLLVEGP